MRDLRAFLDVLRAEGELVEIDAEVNPNLEIAEVHRRVIAAGGPALLFKRPTGSSFPVVTNLFGTKKRVDLAFGRRANDFVKRAAGLPHELMPPSLGKLWGLRDFGWQALDLGLQHAARGPVTEVVTAPNLSRIPMLTSWPEDSGAFVTLPLVYTEHPETHVHNLGMYRIERKADNRTGMHWQIGKGGGFHHHVAEQRHEALPVNLFVGGPPGLIASAIAPLPENVPELLLASLLVGERLRRCDNPAGPLPLVADCEFAIVGEVPPHLREPEGPFGDHYGYYSLQHDFPVFNVAKVCHRKDAIWPATVVGKPRQEDFFLGDWLQELLSPLFPVVMPAVRDLWSYGETGYHALSAAVVQERYRREAMASAFRILGEGQLSLTKFLLLLDQPMDLKNFQPVLEHVLARFRPETDLYVLSNLSMDTLDYAGPALNEGSKAVMMGVGPAVRELPRQFRGELPGGVGSVAVYCGGCLVVSGPAYAEEPGAADRLAANFPGWPLVVLVDDAREATRSDSRFLWTAFTRMEPAADLHGARRIHRNHVVFEGSIVLDARKKPTYPAELFCDPDTAATVDRRWAEYFPSGKVEMGDSDVGHLDR
ncbi:4-hydroxybenzoate decarboxylase subunit C [Deltaproteobacteria bacterium]|nr:4-hydroxybenzoate decarboxylase subunit C [Deltaproteobacteria bacterium]